jgi:DNA-binding GntR family transcriptional regulator
VAIADQIASTLRQEIIFNVLKQDSPLSENELAKRFKTSRTPIREATQRLANEHLVRIVPGRGAFIASLDIGQVASVYEVRLALEPLAARSSFGMLRTAGLDELAQRWIELEKRARDLDSAFYNEIAALDRETHHFFTHKTPNLWLRNFLSLLDAHIYRMQNLSIIGLGEAKASIDQHLELIRLAQTKDLDAFLKALRNHIVASAEYLRANIDLS